MSALVEKRIAILGSGDPVGAYRDALAAFPELTLDPVQGTHTVAGRAGRRASPAEDRPVGVEDLLERCVAPTLALLCTPPAGHLEEARSLLLAGTDLLIECPLAPSCAEAEAISTLAERLGRVVMTTAAFRVFEAVLEARRLIDAGRIGPLQRIEITLSCKRDGGPLRGRSPGQGPGGVWLGYGPDALDLVEMLAGPLQRIRMLSVDPLQGATVEDQVEVEAEHEPGVISRMHLSWNELRPAPIARCTGGSGEILVGWAQSVLCTHAGKELFAKGFEAGEVRQAILARFLRECRRRQPGEDHGSQALAWIEAARRSLKSRRWEIS